MSRPIIIRLNIVIVRQPATGGTNKPTASNHLYLLMGSAVQPPYFGFAQGGGGGGAIAKTSIW